jgi:hypothetical protein
MSSYREKFLRLGVHVPNILLPSRTVDYREWSVVACDQYSSERDYWTRVAGHVGSSPSTLNLIFPECYLDDADKDERILRIQKQMRDYTAKGVLESKGEIFVLVERHTPYEAAPRIGLVLALDLENYSFDRGSKSLIRPTEGTIIERLPPRMAIRRGAELELPHIMVLIDDPNRTVIEPLYAIKERYSKLYDFDLMENSGHIRGWAVKDDATFVKIAAALENLANPNSFRERYGSDDVLLFAVGDGNHSLATAKAIWEETKKSLSTDPASMAKIENHPSRFALVELINLYDEGLPFHPIHRVLFNVDESQFFDSAQKNGAEIERFSDSARAFTAVDAAVTDKSRHTIGFTSFRDAGIISFIKPKSRMAAGTVQDIVDTYLSNHPSTSVDYIHGSESLEALGEKKGNLGLYLPPVDKHGFFETVIRDGVMPRKTFSMGEAPEKRFYLEARKIFT